MRCPLVRQEERGRSGASRPVAPAVRELPGDCSTPALQHHPIVVSDADFERLVEHSPLPVLLEFWSPYCLYCQQLAPTIERLAQSDSDRLRVATLNIDEQRRTPARYGVSATPTLLVLDRGRELDRVQGALTEDQLRYRLYKYLN